MLPARSVWRRVLHLYEQPGAVAGAGSLAEDSLYEPRVHARSRFRSLDDTTRFALYYVHDAEAGVLLSPGLFLGPAAAPGEGEHTLVAVREFRRVPLDASSLALTVFTARPGRAVAVVAALAAFVERAVDRHQPAYLLLAHSMERPCLSLLLTAVDEALALGSAATAAFSLDVLLPEVASVLVAPPESYVHCPESASASVLSPYAV
jgi:hypothetical protein